jgi:hypothetical protein
VLTTTLTPRARCPDWVHWPQARAPAALRAADWFRSFNPVLRLSRRFARGYIATIESPGWEGHYEFTIPTIARHLRLGIEDIARPGRRMHGMKLPVWLVPHARPALYRNTPAAPWLGPGTFIYRPSRSSYFHERPEEFPEAGRLYHPIKPA